MKVFIGTIVHSLSFSELEIIENGALAVNDDGKIKYLKHDSSCINEPEAEIIKLEPNSFLIPGFVDTHIHAPQYVFTGTGYDLGLLEWLQKYTFPRESAFKDPEYALDAYNRAVNRSLYSGTTTACYYGTIHVEACKILANVVGAVGQRAFIGKVNMDSNSPDYYIESTSDSIAKTLEFCDYVEGLQNDLIKPVITPRFAPSCSLDLMSQLGKISRERGILVQTHISETCAECEWVKSLFPHHDGYADVYYKNGLLTEKSVMAHCVYLTQQERELFFRVGAGISHCPSSNLMIQSGILNVRRLINEGFTKIGLGSGEFTLSIRCCWRAFCLFD